MGKKSKKIETVSVQHEGTIYNVTPVLKKVILSLQQDSEKMKKLIFECEIAKGDVKTRDAEIIRLKQQIEQLEFANRKHCAAKASELNRKSLEKEIVMKPLEYTWENHMSSSR